MVWRVADDHTSSSEHFVYHLCPIGIMDDSQERDGDLKEYTCKAKPSLPRIKEVRRQPERRSMIAATLVSFSFGCLQTRARHQIADQSSAKLITAKQRIEQRDGAEPSRLTNLQED